MSEVTPAKRLRLQRLADALQRRDWLGLLFEILVVTLGVLVAFQIDQWGQDRQRRAQERQFLEQIYADSRSGAEELRTIVEWHRKVVREAGQAIQSAGNPGRIEALPDRNDFGCGIPGLPSAPYNDTAYADIVESGRLGLLTDPRLRTAVRDLAASQASGASEVASSRQQLLLHLPPLDPYYRLGLGTNSEPLCRIDWPRLLRDQSAVNAATRAIRRHLQTLQAREQTYDRTLRVQRMVACKLGKRECRK
jgi:hypothetical protein